MKAAPPEVAQAARGATGWWSGSTEISLRNSTRLAPYERSQAAERKRAGQKSSGRGKKKNSSTNGTKVSGQDNAKRSAQRVPAAAKSTDLAGLAELAELAVELLIEAALHDELDFVIAWSCPARQAGR